jgi:hypothetical protein
MKQDGTNPFGGKNPHGMYVPITDDEMEVVARIAERGGFKLVVRDWGHVDGFRLAVPGERYAGKPLVVMGDKRISFYFRMSFSAPDVPQPNWYFDIEVWAFDRILFSKRMPTEHNGHPIEVVAGMSIDLALDIALDSMDPAFVKAIKPGALGLTTRHGNLHLDQHHQKILHQTRSGEKAVREMSDRDAVDVTRKARKMTEDR